MTRQINLTPKQLRVLEVIRDSRRRDGYAPTMQEIAEALGITKVTVFEHVESLLRKGALRRNPHKARSLSVVDETIIPERDAPKVTSMTFPLVGRIAAGYPIEQFPQCDDLAIAELYAPRNGTTAPTFLLEADGDAMRADGVLDGDYVVIEQREDPTDGERVVVTLADGETIMRRYYRQSDGTIRLQPTNAGDETIVVTGCRVHGVVVGVLRKYA